MTTHTSARKADSPGARPRRSDPPPTRLAGEATANPVPLTGLVRPAAADRSFRVGPTNESAAAGGSGSPALERLRAAGAYVAPSPGDRPHGSGSTVLRRLSVPAPSSGRTDAVTVGIVTVVPDSVPSDRPADAAGTIRRLWDVSVKPVAGHGGTFIIGNIVIKDRPKGPDTSQMAQQGGKSFHHESAWALMEKHVTQFIGQPMAEVVGYLVKYGIAGIWPAMKDPGADQMVQLITLNTYFHEFLEAKASAASGWLGPTGSHASQGGKISSALNALNSTGWSKLTIFKALTVSFEPDPGLKGAQLWRAAQEHGDAFYGAFQQYLEAEGLGAAVSLKQHEDILEWIKDWDTQYWSPDYDESMTVDQ